MTRDTVWKITGGACVVLAFITGIFFQFRYGVNADNAIMIEFARRMWDGGMAGVDYYDTMPPFGVLLYLPVIALSKISGLPLYYSLTSYVLALVFLSAGLCWKIILEARFVDRANAFIFVALYILANLYIGGIFFGERDHIVLLGLLPLVMAQLALYQNIRLPRAVLYFALVLGSIMLLVKPHYALMPTFMIAVRLYARKKNFLKTLLLPDFIVLSLVAVAGLIAALTVYSLFFKIVAPDILRLYAGKQVVPLFSHRFMILVFILPALSVAAILQKEKKFFLTLAATALCLVIAYLAQFKGYSYHLVPAGIVAFTTAALLLCRIARGPALIAAVAALVILFPARLSYPTHSTYQTLPLSRALEHCKAPCSFFASTDYNYLVYETALYKGAFQASRFPGLWFGPYLACGYAGRGKNVPDRAELDRLFNKYAVMVTEDLARYKPSTVILFKGNDLCGNGQSVPFDFVRFFSRNPGFAREWKHYVYKKPLTFNRRPYFAGTSADYDNTMNFDVYGRAESP